MSTEVYCPLDKDVQKKLSTIGTDLEPGIRAWIEGMTGEKFPPGPFAKGLKNGVLLCKLANKIKPGICPKFQDSNMPFVQMENIGSYLNAAKQLGVQGSELFMTVDLYEEKNIGQVIRNLDVLRRITNTGHITSANGASPVSRSAPSSSAASPPASRTSPKTSPRVPVGVVPANTSSDNDPLCPLDKDLKDKLSTIGAGLEGDIRAWIEKMTGERFSDPSFAKSLKNGVLLCKLANKIQPGICPKVQNSPAPFVQMENIGSYLNAARKLGVDASELFMTVDLYEEKNVGQVIRNLDALRRVTGKY